MGRIKRPRDCDKSRVEFSLKKQIEEPRT